MTGYPRYNVVRVGDSGHRVEVAVPGWDKEDIEITFHKNELRIEGTAKQVAEENEDYLYKGLSGKTFSRVFKVGNNIELETAYHEEWTSLCRASREYSRRRYAQKDKHY